MARPKIKGITASKSIKRGGVPISKSLGRLMLGFSRPSALLQAVLYFNKKI